jgi:uncharacterized protein YbcI
MERSLVLFSGSLLGSRDITPEGLIGWRLMSNDDGPRPLPAQHEAVLEISNEMVRLYKRLFGRGPTHARTHFASPDMVVCTLEGSFTPAERSLAELGEHQRLREMRLFFQHAREDDFRETVERLTGRRVRGFLSGTDTVADISCEVFYLEPTHGEADRLHAV